jgi:cell division protein FtsB
MKMLEKIKKYKSSETVKSFSDVRSLGMLAFGIIAILVTWSSVKVVESNYNLQKQISTLQQQTDVEQLANNNLKLKNEYLNTDEYLELAARRHYNKAAPGEKLLIVPKEVALAHSIDAPKLKTAADSVSETAKASGSSFQQNFNAWVDFLFHKQTD